MVELGQQGQPAMRGHGLFRPFQCESEHRVSYHHLTLSVHGCVWSHTRDIRD